MGKMIRGSEIVWADPNGGAKGLDVLYDVTDQAVVWHEVWDAVELELRFELGVAGGAPTSVETVVLVSRDAGVTSAYHLSLDWVSAGVASLRTTILSIPVAAPGAGLVALNFVAPAIPIAPGCMYSVQSKRTGGAAGNTLRVTATVVEV